MKLFFILLLLFICNCFASPLIRNLVTLYEWNVLVFGFPFESDEKFAIENGLNDSKLARPLDVDLEYRDNDTFRVFVTVPRFRTSSIPYTLAIITEGTTEIGPILTPYPDFVTHLNYEYDCSGITSASRIFIDECKRLWVVDTGVIDGYLVCPPKLLAYDLNTDKLLHRYWIPNNQYESNSVLGTVIVDVLYNNKKMCKHTMIYIADVTAYSLIVYDLAKGKSWSVKNYQMIADPDWSNITLNRDTIFTVDGIYSMSLSPKNIKNRRMFFHSLASNKEYSVSLDLINNRKIWKYNTRAYPEKFSTVGSRDVQCAAEAMDSLGYQYCVLTNPTALYSWDSYIRYNKNSLKIVAYNPETMQLGTSIKIVWNSYDEEELWVLTNRQQKEPKNPNEVNYRIMGCNVDKLNDFRSSCSVAALPQPLLYK